MYARCAPLVQRKSTTWPSRSSPGAYAPFEPIDHDPTAEFGPEAGLSGIVPIRRPLQPSSVDRLGEALVNTPRWACVWAGTQRDPCRC